MKKFLLAILIFCYFEFSYALEDLEKVMGAFSPAGYYEKISKYYEGNTNEFYSNAYDKIASLYGTDVSTIKSIIGGDLTLCTKLFYKMQIKEPAGGYTEKEYYACENKIISLVNNYTTSSVNNQTADSATKGENVLADGIAENGPYDLLIDIETLSKIIFKEEIKFDDVAFKVKIGNKKDKSNSGGDDKNTNNNGNNNGETNENSNGTNPDESSNSGAGTNNGNENNNLESTNGENGNNIVNNGNNTIGGNYQNENLQFGNICLDTNGNGLTNGGGTGGGTGSGGGDGNEDGFDTFKGGKDEKGGFANGGGGNIVYDDLNGYNIFTGEDGIIYIGAGGKQGEYCPPEDYILAICVKLIPSGPRGPVGGTVRKRSIEEIIDKINDSLKEAKQNWIVTAGHGDESLGVDYKQLDLANMFTFNLVLNKKPVFNFKLDDRALKETNSADTNWQNVPRKLAKLYYDIGTGDPFDKENDKNKYLLTNTDFVKPSRKVNNNYSEKVDGDSDKGIYTYMGRFEDITKGLYNMTNNFDDISKKLKSSSQTFNGKADITNF